MHLSLRAHSRLTGNPAKAAVAGKLMYGRLWRTAIADRDSDPSQAARRHSASNLGLRLVAAVAQSLEPAGSSRSRHRQAHLEFAVERQHLRQRRRARLLE